MGKMDSVRIVRHPDDETAATPPVSRAVVGLENSLAKHGLAIRHGRSAGEPVRNETCVMVSGLKGEPARKIIGAAGVSIPDTQESFAILPGNLEGREVLLVCGADVLGLVYAVLELTDRIVHGQEPEVVLAPRTPVIEEPVTPIRSITRLFTSEVEDRSWFHDQTFWPRYLSMLAAQRFNRFSLALGLGYNFPRDIHDAYFYFPYPFLLSVPGYDVRVPGLSDLERDRNLESLEFIARETVATGLRFQLALWTHAYEWIDSPDANYVVHGLTPDNHAAYCRDGLRMLLESCPEISGVTLRVHGESGVPEGSYDFWKTLFEGITGCGRRIEIDMHPKGIDAEMIETALVTGLPVNVSPKYAAEHMGLPYQQASIRELERLPRETESGAFMALSGGTRKFLRYNHGDLLTTDRSYGVLYRVWPGTQRLLLWGDPAMAAGYGRYGNFSGCLGVEFFEPLSFKGRMGSGLPGGRDGYADTSLRPEGGDWEKYLYTYRLFGRLLYDPEADPDVWRRFLRKTFGPAAASLEEALANASRILPLLTTAHHPSASNNAYWPEMYTNMPIVNETRPHPYSDSPSPKRFGSVSPLDPEIFSSIDDFAEELIDGRLSGRYSPLDVTGWLDGCCDSAEAGLSKAEAEAPDPTELSFRRAVVDVKIQIGIGRFFAHKLKAGLKFAIYERLGDFDALKRATAEYRLAREAWAKMAGQAADVYVEDLSFGLTPHLRGHWSDRLAAIDDDIGDMEKVLYESAGGQAGDEKRANAVRSFLSVVSTGPRKLSFAHTPPDDFRPGAPVDIDVTGSEAEGCAIQLHYRHVNQAERYVVTDMRKQEGGYVATIPGAYTDSPYPLQYFLTARDGEGRARIYPGLNKTLSNQPYYSVQQVRSYGS